MKTHLFSVIYVKKYVNIKERFSEVSALRSSNFSSEAQKFLECSRGKKWICSKKPRCSRIRASKRSYFTFIIDVNRCRKHDCLIIMSFKKLRHRLS